MARNVRRLRVRKGLSQEALAVDAGIDRTYVSRIERGLENPTVAVLEKFAKVFGVDISDLFLSSAAIKSPVEPLPGGRKKSKGR